MNRIAFRRMGRECVRQIVMIASFLGVMACLGGCSTVNQAEIDPAWKLDEHGNPDFKPGSFDDAIAELKSRYGELASLASPETSAAARQFRQIIRWLPEFAADTPIRRAGWEELSGRTARMESAARQSGYFALDRVAAFDKEMNDLAGMIPPDTLYRKPETRSKHEGKHEGDGNEAGSADSSHTRGPGETPAGTLGGSEGKGTHSKGHDR